MNRRNQWVLFICLGLLSLVMAAAIALRVVTHFSQNVRSELRESCLQRVVTFEEFAERSIVRGQLDSLEGAAMLLLMGDGLYVDVAVSDGMLYSDHDEGLTEALLPESLKLDLPLTEVLLEELPHGAIEVLAPISLAGYEGSSIGVIRVGFSGDYANALVKQRLSLVVGWGVGGWLAIAIGLVWALGLARRVSLPKSPESSPIIQCGTLRIDTQTCEVTLNDQPIDLTPKLYDLLLLFARKCETILTDQDILNAIWSDSSYAASPDVKQCVYMLRRSLGAAHSDPKKVIVNVKGFGYRFDPLATDDDLSID